MHTMIKFKSLKQLKQAHITINLNSSKYYWSIYIRKKPDKVILILSCKQSKGDKLIWHYKGTQSGLKRLLMSL